MILTKNEVWLLARGYTFEKEDIRISLHEYKIIYNEELKSVYHIADIEEAKELYKKYKKTYRRKLGIFKDEFVNNTLIVQLTQSN